MGGDENPFKEDKNPEYAFKVIWAKLDSVEKIAVENRTDIKWLKREYSVQLVFTLGMFLTLLVFMYNLLK